MAEQQNPKLDPFKPAQPHIPGVPQPGATSSGASPGGLLAVLTQPHILLSFLGSLAFLIGISVWLYSRQPGQPITAASAPSDSTKPAAASGAPSIPVAPGEIATTDELAKPWSSKRFDFVDPDTHLTVPALVVHLAHGGYWGFSLREPFGGCHLEYVTDLKRLASTYGVKSDHPMIGDPCDYSVFDLMKYGPTTDNSVVRGAVVHGTALRPPIAIEIRVDGRKVIAERRE
ncbi:MAG: hypothetical protein WCC76_05290 [Candidatus Acidiferrales bacterium]|jgi:hypothetical protein